MKILALALIILATSGTTSECGAGLPKSCTVLFRGLEVENEQVTDVLRPVCDPEHLPQRHKIHAWIEHKPFGGEWEQVGRRTPLVFDIPDEEGFDIKVRATCEERGLAWVWWQLRRPVKRLYRRMRRMYFCCWPPPEVSSYISMMAMIVGKGAVGRLHVGSVGVVTKSEVYGDHRVYHIEFEINRRPRMVLSDRTPTELFAALPASSDLPPLRR